MYDIVNLGKMDYSLEPRHNIATFMSSVLDLCPIDPNAIGRSLHDMVTPGRKANTKSLGTILPTDGWTGNLIPVTPVPPPPPTCCREEGIIMIKGSLLIPNIHLLSH